MTSKGSHSMATDKRPIEGPSLQTSKKSQERLDELAIEESTSPKSPGKMGRLKVFLTRSPRKDMKSPDKEDNKDTMTTSPTKVDETGKKADTKIVTKDQKASKLKKPTKTKKGKKEAKKTKDSVVKSTEEPSQGTPSDVKDTSLMVQTTLATTTDELHVISSPEQPEAKVQRQKSGKKFSASRSSRKSKKQSPDEEKTQTRISDIFPLRKSGRVPKSEQKKNELAKITEAIKSNKAEGLEVCQIEGKGRGVFATKEFGKDEFVCEYAGELINFEEAKKREEEYSNDEEIGCYMYYIQHSGKKYCIDATTEDGTFGRLLNHSRTGGNCKTRIHAIKNKPHLILVTTRPVKKGEELTYDYGERSKTVVDSHPWLKH